MTVAPPGKRKLDPLAAFLTYLLPGLGQIVQGRVGKGILYFVCLYGLFFYGLAMGNWKNVWLGDYSGQTDVQLAGRKLPGVFKDLSYRREFAGQFWIGIAAWPALLQYQTTEPIPKSDDPGKDSWQPKPSAIFGSYMQVPPETELNRLQRDGDKRWDLGWVFTVIAGVLNILVIYDALAGPVVKEEDEPKPTPKPTTGGAA